MAHEHWFDIAARAAFRAATRRELTRFMTVVLPVLLLGGVAHNAAGKKKGGKGKGNGNSKGKGHGKGKGKPKPNPPERCGHALCAAEWPDDAFNRNDCELKCGHCRIREKFCIIEGDPTDPDNIATCCFENQSCCPDASSPTGLSCLDTFSDPDRCGACDRPCRPDQECFRGSCFCKGPRERDCAGRCIDVSYDNRNCGGCDTVCSPTRHCVEGNCLFGAPIDCPDGFAQCSEDECISIRTDDNCGRCFNRCHPNEDCVDGTCRVRSGVVCPEGFGNCYESGDPCAFLRTDDNHCGRCHNRCDGARHCVDGSCAPLTEDEVHSCPAPGGGEIFIPDTWACCDNNIGYCREGYSCVSGNCIR